MLLSKDKNKIEFRKFCWIVKVSVWVMSNWKCFLPQMTLYKAYEQCIDFIQNIVCQCYNVCLWLIITLLPSNVSFSVISRPSISYNLNSKLQNNVFNSRIAVNRPLFLRKKLHFEFWIQWRPCIFPMFKKVKISNCAMLVPFTVLRTRL